MSVFTRGAPPAYAPKERPDGAKVNGEVRRRFKIGPPGYLIGVFVLVAIIGSLVSPHFLTMRNLENIAVAASVVAVLGVAQFIVIVTRGIDLSVGSVAALSTVIAAVMLQQGHGVFITVIVTIAACSLAGLINGILVVYARIAPFVATLAMMSIARGVAFLVQVGTLIVISDRTFLTIFGGNTGSIPNVVIIALAVTLIAAFVMRFGSVGRRLYALGGNPEAARLSGLPVKRDQVMAYTTSGALAGLAGLMLAGRLSQGSSLVGQGYELDSIAAAVVGGTSLFGGTGDPISTVLGALIIGMIGNIMNLAGIQSEPQMVILGIVILLAVFLTSGGGIQRIRAALSKLRPKRNGVSDSTPASSPEDVPISRRPDLEQGVDSSGPNRQSNNTEGNP
ncbi:ABC transporter permease [Hoyosella subflava]|uniref:Putative D-ribose ABC transporter permease protein n=1 Tax=Hoyosella subflava (strain DSM 45089 / JCM 17490 / NBRC 109087 / DQS3-9A1) TaxID=443218 RepID=F6ER00_HOYSD|nr:ABC transporter permease [Hoyosella subflava]AEF40687.1 Putative D-ribose ABC transporter permease protein [Hoyosella subflava DQS3-9A1]